MVKNIDLDTKIMSVCGLELILHATVNNLAAILKKWPKFTVPLVVGDGAVTKSFSSIKRDQYTKFGAVIEK